MVWGDCNSQGAGFSQMIKGAIGEEGGHGRHAVPPQHGGTARRAAPCCPMHLSPMQWASLQTV